VICVFIGKKGSGKSALCRKLVYLRLTSPGLRPLVLYHDPKGNIAPDAGRSFGSVESARAEWEANQTLPQLSVFRGRNVNLDKLAELALDVGHCTLVFDELDRCFSGKSFRYQNVERVFHEGRNDKVDLFGTFRAPRNVSEDVIGQSDWCFLFRFNANAYWDLDQIKRRFGPHYSERVQEIEPFQFVVWADR